ncbi:hypothetical protein XM38_009800 [Halomicronema hongdechloris C2206]|uniref:HTH marR-type domain-containing protein n=2 Tax=Halomicronema hongdechloris TaxID=1209493 RepID=A0A1Z3HID7_9CYAN|nr:hypothetical protein XM38_009800 [Halomicronema hongdechloris C2206]
MVGLTKIGLAIKSQNWQAADALGLSPTQGHILALLQHPHGSGTMRLGDIAQALAITPATASDAVRVLVDKGLVQKKRAADDRRAIAIGLTSAGQQQAAVIADWSDFLLTAVNQLSAEEQAIFLQGLIKIIGNLQQQGKISVARMCITCQHFRPNAHTDARHPHHCTFIDAPIGGNQLQIDCPDYLATPSTST